MFADGTVIVGGNRGNIDDLVALGDIDRLRNSSQFFDNFADCFLDSTIDGVRVGAGCDIFEAFPVDRLSEYRCGGRAVAGHAAGLGGSFLDHLGAEIFVLVVQVNFVGDGHAVFGDTGRAPALINNCIAAAGTQRGFHRVG